jgi:iron complex transport system substrate-binding protein
MSLRQRRPRSASSRSPRILTELVYTAGAGLNLVGAIEHSDYPPAARELPRVGDAYGLDFERIGSLHPDLILAWDGGTPERWIERLRELGYRVVPLGARRLEDVGRELEEIGRLSGHEDLAQSAASTYGSSCVRCAPNTRAPTC